MSRDRGSDSLSDETVPTEPPHPGLLPVSPDPQLRAGLLDGMVMAPYLGSRLVHAAHVLARISEAQQGGYLQGLDLPETSRAAATGAIAIACAALEGTMNDFLFFADVAEHGGTKDPHSQLLRAMVKLTPLKRYEHLAALHGEIVAWTNEPAQSMALLFSVRKHLLHHEGGAYTPRVGFWPTAKLRGLARQISTPYPIEGEAPLSWDQHILTPRGATWAVRTMDRVLVPLNAWWDRLNG